MHKLAVALLCLLILTACGSAGRTAAPPLASPTAGISSLPIVPTTVPDPQLTALPTRSLLPPETLTTAELHQRLDPFTEVVPGCVLPCFNGLSMGQSTLYDVYDFYSRLGIGLRDLIPGDYDTVQDGTGRLGAWLITTTDVAQAEDMGLKPPLVNITITDNIAQSLYVGWEFYPAYLTVPIILESLNQPDQLTLAVEPASTGKTYVLQLVYSGAGLAFAFTGDMVAAPAGQQMCLTPDQVQASALGLFAPGQTPMADMPYNDLLLPLEETIGVPYADFAARISAGECILVPASALPTWESLPTSQPD